MTWNSAILHIQCVQLVSQKPSDLSETREASLHSAIDWPMLSNVFHTGANNTCTNKAQHVVLMCFEAGQKEFDFLQNLTGHYSSLGKTFVFNYTFETFLTLIKTCSEKSRKPSSVCWHSSVHSLTYIFLSEEVAKKTHVPCFLPSLRKLSETKTGGEEWGPWTSLFA